MSTKYKFTDKAATGFVELAESWKCSSAVDYNTKDIKGILEIVTVY